MLIRSTKDLNYSAAFEKFSDRITLTVSKWSLSTCTSKNVGQVEHAESYSKAWPFVTRRKKKDFEQGKRSSATVRCKRTSEKCLRGKISVQAHGEFDLANASELEQASERLNVDKLRCVAVCVVESLLQCTVPLLRVDTESE